MRLKGYYINVQVMPVDGPNRQFSVQISLSWITDATTWFGDGYIIHLYAPKDASSCQWLLQPEPSDSRRFGLDTRLRQIKSWLRNCLSSHRLYCSHETAWLPKRVLDLWPSDCELRLYESQNESGRYICLSHRWGDSQPLQTTKATLEAWKTGIGFEALPRTFQDAIIISRGLGIRYLWIDSLCIVQDDPEDWAEQASSMCDVYQGAFLTIAGTRCESSSDPLVPSFPHLVDSFNSRGEPNKVAVRIECLHLDVEHSRNPLLARGWVFQERLLSRRMVHFGFDEIYWECMESTSCECNENIVRGGLPIKSVKNRIPRGATEEDLRDIWHELVTSYTTLAFTKVPDRLPAILGLAKETEPYRKGKYLVGLWESSIIADLAWRRRSKRGLTLRPVQEETLAPTWSWATINGACEYSSNWKDGATIMLNFQEPDFSKFPADKTALGCLSLKGQLVEGRSDNSPPNRTMLAQQPMHQWLARSFSWPGRVLYEPDVHDEGGVPSFVPDGEPAFCLALGSDSTARQQFEVGLVLRLVDRGRQLYERIGVANILDGWDCKGKEFFERGVEAVVNLV